MIVSQTFCFLFLLSNPPITTFFSLTHNPISQPIPHPSRALSLTSTQDGITVIVVPSTLLWVTQHGIGGLDQLKLGCSFIFVLWVLICMV